MKLSAFLKGLLPLLIQFILLFFFINLLKIRLQEYGDEEDYDDSDQADGDIDDDEDDDVCEQMSRGSEGVHSQAPIGLFLPLPACLLACLDLIPPGPYRRCTNPPSLPIPYLLRPLLPVPTSKLIAF